MEELNLKYIVEALLIATDTPLSVDRISAITNSPGETIRSYIEELNQEYRTSQRAFEIKEIAGGFQIYTLPEFAEWVGSLHDQKSKLSKAALETLAIIAYHQPITRPEIEKLRGVDSSWVLDTLLQKGLIKTSGRLPVPGRPIKYITSKEFLRYFSIKDLSELPREEDFGERVAERETPVDSSTLESNKQSPDSTTEEIEETTSDGGMADDDVGDDNQG